MKRELVQALPPYPYSMMVAMKDGTYAGTKYEKQVFVQPGSNVFAHDNSFCGGI